VTPRSLTIIAVGAVALGLVAPGAATAGGGKAESTVTIRAEGADLSGYVKSPRPRKCAQDRKVVVFKQVGTEQDPRNDDRIASDIASLNGDKAEWSTGNTGVYGRLYARVGPTPDCKSDTSDTIRVRRP
jgi:hypothetical protein